MGCGDCFSPEVLVAKGSKKRLMHGEEISIQ